MTSVQGADVGNSPDTLWVPIPAQDIVSVEHPGVVKDVKNAIDSLGGAVKVAQFLQSQAPNRSLSLSLSGDEQFRRRIVSRSTANANIVAKITIPKPTGRKRKRGSNDPFDFYESNERHNDGPIRDVLTKYIGNNARAVTLEPIGVIRSSHRFRDIPDFQYSVADSRIVRSMSKSLLPLKYPDFRTFDLDQNSTGVQADMDMLPPPSFSQFNMHHNYGYTQTGPMKMVRNHEGKRVAVVAEALPSTASQLCSFDAETVPSRPAPDFPSEELLEPRLQQLLAAARKLYENRPIYTRRVLINLLGVTNDWDVKCIMPYMCYIFRSGPWKDSYIKYGVDPRIDPECRFYQTITFQIPIKDESKQWTDGRVRWQRSEPVQKKNRKTHMFDGKSFVPDGKIWQICDIQDSFLRSILGEDSLRSECDIYRDGWYNNGAWAKFRMIMRDKIRLILKGQEPNDTDYYKLRQIPDFIDPGSDQMQAARILTFPTKRLQDLATLIRNNAIIGRHLAKKAAKLKGFLDPRTGVARAQSKIDIPDPQGEDDVDEPTLPQAEEEATSPLASSEREAMSESEAREAMSESEAEDGEVNDDEMDDEEVDNNDDEDEEEVEEE